MLSLSNTFGQGVLSDSLKQLAQTATDDSVKVSALLQLAFNSIFNNSQQASQYLSEAKNMLATRPMPYSQVYYQYVLAVYYDITGMSDSARHYFEQGLAKSRADKLPELEVKFLNGLGLNNWNRGFYQTALDQFLQVLQLNQQLEAKYRIPESTPYNNLGLIYQELGMYQKALEYHQKALDIRLADGKLLAQVSTSYNNIGICLYHLKRYTEAEEVYRKGITLANEHQFLRQYYDLAGNLANTLVGQGRYKEALSWIEKILSPNTTIVLQDKFIMNQHAAAAGILIQLKQPEKARQHIQKALHLLSEKPDLEFYAEDVYQYAAQLYCMLGDVKLGKDYSDKMEVVLENKFSKRNADALAEMEIKYKTAEKERLLLNKQLEVEEKNLALVRQRNQNILLLAGLVIVSLLSVIFLLHYRFKQRQQLQQVVIDQQKKGLQAIIQATEQERQRIARDLHDSVGQQLAGVKMKWQAWASRLTDKSARETADAIAALLQKTADEVRTLSHQMMPKSLMELGLVPALSELCLQAFDQTGIRWEFTHHQAEARLAEQIELAVYRSTQELISNVIRHSGADRVSLQLYRVNHVLRLTVEDNGNGFNPDGLHPGHGINNIRSRINAVNGKLLVESNGEEGTVVSITIPLPGMA
jgi:signal transduction histidine kinase/Tfp pilus assembly protein PilF